MMLNEIKIDKNNYNLLEDKRFCALFYSTEGAMGEHGLCCPVDFNGNFYKIKYISYDVYSIPISWLVKDHFPFLKDYEFVSMDSFDLFCALAKGNSDIYHRKDKSKWNHIYMGYGNSLFVNEKIYKFVSEQIESLQPHEIYSIWEDVVNNALTKYSLQRQLSHSNLLCKVITFVKRLVVYPFNSKE